MRTLKNILAFACAAALAVPAAVVAQAPSGDHGNSGDHGKPQNTKPHHVNKRCRHQPMVGYNARGTLDATSTADSLVVNITKVKSGSKAFKLAYPKQVTIDTHAVTVDYQGANPFTTDPAPDVTKYTVHITGKAPKSKKGCDPANSKPPTFKKVQVKAPETSEQPEQEQTTTTTTQTQS